MHWTEAKKRQLSPEALLKELGLYQVPVPVIRAASVMGVPVMPLSDLSYEGEVASSAGDGKAVIRVNTSHPEARQRFTIAHEIGHLMLHPSGRRFRDIAGQSHTLQEREANQYAARLLAPSELLRRFGDAAIIAGKGSEELAGIFNVSPQMMKYRLNEVYGRRAY